MGRFGGLCLAETATIYQSYTALSYVSNIEYIQILEQFCSNY